MGFLSVDMEVDEVVGDLAFVAFETFAFFAGGSEDSVRREARASAKVSVVVVALRFPTAMSYIA